MSGQDENILFAAPINLESGRPLNPDLSKSVTFHLESVSGASNSWLATLSSNGPTASFRFELDPPYAQDDSTEPPLFFGEGRFISVEASDASALIFALAHLLEATTIPVQTTRADVLPFVYTRFSEQLSPAPGGGFQLKPAGTWTLTKLFLGGNTEEDEGEVFVAINPSAEEGSFLMKDPDYGDILLRHLATIL